MHRHSPYSTNSTGDTHDNNIDNHDSYSPFRPQDSASAAAAAPSSSFLRQSILSNNNDNNSNSNNNNNNPLSNSSTTTTPAHDPPPLMPLFTPVLQTFQSQYGSSIFQQDDHLQEQEGYEQDDFDQYGHQPRLSDFQNGLNQHEQDRSHRQHQQKHRQHYHHHGPDEDDDEEEEGIDPDASSRRNLLYAGEGEVSSSAHSSDGGRRGNNPYFQSNRPLASGPFALNRPNNNDNNNARGGHGNLSLLRPNLDIGTDHEAPASLMIEMNQQHQDEDDSAGYWNFGDRARRRLQYKRPGMNAAELAMWKWVNVENLDNFLARVSSGNTGYSSFACINEQTAVLSLIMESDQLLH
jgi:hypothetical protein